MRSPFSKRHSVAYTDPLLSGRHPFQTYLLTLCVVSGIPLMFGEPTAESIEAVLPEMLARGWGYALTLGAMTGLVGSYWPRRKYATALTIERIGLIITGPAGLFYAFAIVVVVGAPGIIAGAIIFAFGAACIRRARDLGIIMKRALANGDSLVVRREDESSAEAVIRDDNEGE